LYALESVGLHSSVPPSGSRRGWVGEDQPVVGKAAHHEVVTLVSKTNDQWWLVRTDAGEEGYASAQYLSPQN